MQNNEIMVSICCLVYNHEKYLRQCLDGFITQKTNFKYEILIHDDASTDSSADIIREYEQKYPDIIKPIYQTENQYSKGVKISWKFQYPRAKGKYIAFCEGDDYWCDENKLQMQFDIMEKNADCSMCVHSSKRIDTNGKEIGLIEAFKEQKKFDMSVFLYKKYINKNEGFQTSSFFIRKNIILKMIQEKEDFAMKSEVGDLIIVLYACDNGNIVYLPKIMSVYRTNQSNSWTGKMCQDKERTKQYNYNMIQRFKEFNIYTNYKYDELIQMVILQYNFVICMLNKDYKEMIKRKYNQFWHIYSIKYRIYVILCALIPVFENVYEKIKESLNE